MRAPRLLFFVVGLAACSSAASPGGGEPGGLGPDASAGRDAPSAPRDGGFDSTPSPDSGLGVLAFSPETVYSGHDGVHTYRVPIAVYDAAEDLALTADEPAAVDITPVALARPLRADGTFDNGRYFMLTTKKATTVTISAASRGRKASAELVVAGYAASAWTEGETRYTSTSTGGEPACTQCHSGSAGIDHSPASMGSVTDEALGAVITSGISTAGFPIKESSKGHRWDVSEAERNALVTYLRGLEPRGFD